MLTTIFLLTLCLADRLCSSKEGWARGLPLLRYPGESIVFPQCHPKAIGKHRVLPGNRFTNNRMDEFCIIHSSLNQPYPRFRLLLIIPDHRLLDAFIRIQQLA